MEVSSDPEAIGSDYYDLIDDKLSVLVTRWFDDDDKRVIALSTKSVRYLRFGSTETRFDMTIKFKDSIYSGIKVALPIEFILSSDTEQIYWHNDSVFIAIYRHLVIHTEHKKTHEEVFPLLVSCMRPTYLLFWSTIQTDMYGRRHSTLHKETSSKLDDFMRRIFAIQNPCIQEVAEMKRFESILFNAMSRKWSFDMRHFRVLDECGSSILQYKKWYREFLFCARDDDESVMCHEWRKNHYLGHTEPHFRNVLFRLFNNEIQLIMSISNEWVIPDLTTRLILDYIKVLIYDSS